MSRFNQKKSVILILFLAELMFVGMGMSVKASSINLVDHYTIGFYRSFVSVVLIGGFLLIKGQSMIPRHKSLVFFRSIAGAGSMICNFYGISHLMLGDAAMLMNTFPLFVPILSYFFLKQKLPKSLIFYVIISWIGIILIMQPQFNVGQFASLVVLGGAILASIDILMIHLSYKFDHPLVLVFYMALMGSLLCLLFAGDQIFQISFSQFSYLFAAGVCGTFAQIGIIYAYGQGNISYLAPMAYIAVVLSYFAGNLIWSEVPSVMSVVGSIIVTLGCIRVLTLKTS